MEIDLTKYLKEKLKEVSELCEFLQIIELNNLYECTTHIKRESGHPVMYALAFNNKYYDNKYIVMDCTETKNLFFCEELPAEFDELEEMVQKVVIRGLIRDEIIETIKQINDTILRMIGE